MMKTRIESKKTKKVLATSMILFLMVTASYGQGLLVEGAVKLFNALTAEKSSPEFVVIRVDYRTQEVKESGLQNFLASLSQDAALETEAMETIVEESTATVISSLSVANVEVSFEETVETENWMTESLANGVETLPEVEKWMTETFDASLESEVEVESWMTTTFPSTFETDLTTEEWMTEALYTDLEKSVYLENWMTKPMYEGTGIEEYLETEDWMTEQFIIESAETEITVESWMLEPMSNNSEQELVVEGWMTSTLL